MFLTSESYSYKKALMRTFQYAQLMPSNKEGIINDYLVSITNRGQWIKHNKD